MTQSWAYWLLVYSSYNDIKKFQADILLNLNLHSTWHFRGSITDLASPLLAASLFLKVAKNKNSILQTTTNKQEC